MSYASRFLFSSYFFDNYIPGKTFFRFLHLVIPSTIIYVKGDYTIEELTLLSAVVLEGHIKYKVDALSEAVYEHAQALKAG